MVRCPKDDAADCCGKCGKKKVAACIPVHGRQPLVKHTIERLIKKNKVDVVICVGDSNSDRKVCERAGAVWVQHRNNPLGDKWNAAFREAKKYNVDACLFVGSSDWISDNWLDVMLPLIGEFDLIGTHGCNFLHVATPNFYACYWPGYTKDRKGETIGIGRLISSKVLDKLQWEPFHSDLDKSLDFSMHQRVTKVAGKLHSVESKIIQSVSISTDEWGNKHNFWSHWKNRLPSIKIKSVSKWIDENFPEAKEIFQHKTSNHELRETQNISSKII